MFDASNVEQLAQGLDRLYRDFRNRAIAVPDGLTIVNMAIRGAPNEEIRKQIDECRIAWGKVPDN